MSKNKIAKLLLALGIGVVTAASGVAVAGCNNTTDGTDDGTHQEQPKTEYTVQFNLNGGSGAAPANQTVESGEKLTAVADPTHPDGLEFDGWYTAAEGGTKWDFETSTVTSNLTLYAHWKSEEDTNPPGEESELVISSVDFAEWYEETGGANLPSGDTKRGKLEIVGSGGKNKIDNNSSIPALNWQDGNIYFTLNGTENSLTVQARCASSNKSASMTIYKVDSSSGSEVLSEAIATWGGYGTGAWFSTDIENADAEQQDLTLDLEAGTYKITRTNSVRINKFETSEKVEKGTPQSMTVKAGVVDYLVGRSLSLNSVSATVRYTNGAERSVELTIDNFNLSSVNMNAEGTYTVTVSYTENGETVYGDFSVNVYTVKSIELATYTTNGNKQTNFNQIYKVGATFSKEGLTVVATAKCGSEEMQFVLNGDEYTTNTPNLTTVGQVDFVVTAAQKVMGSETAATATLPITVLGDLAVENNTVTLNVDASKDVSTTNFKTITDALTYLKQLNLGADVIKVINIADGEYKEKVFIDIPNVQLIGSDTVKPDHEKDNGVIIVYDALAGATDAAGHTYGTNGSATVTIASGAKDFIAKNITFKNYYNTFELYSKSKEAMSDTQAVALLVESDKATFIGCKLTSYHDTLYSNKGNHYYEQCWIEGHTDYIFGQDAIAYFNDCDIFSIGAGIGEKNGGYVTALKPSDNNNTKYAFIYNHCRFNADENTLDGSVALGRAWGAGMKMVVMNSEISAKFSTAEHTSGTGSGQRYCTMSSNEPKPANMLEYNNTGDGAIDASLNNTCTVLDSATEYDLDNLENIIGWNPAATYYTVTIHYGELTFTLSAKENSTLTLDQIKSALGGSYASYTVTGVYTDVNCQSEYDYEPINSTVELYVTLEEGELIYDTNTTIDLTDYEGTLQNDTGKFKGIEIDATHGKVRGNNNSIQVNPGTIFKIHVNEGATVTVNYYQTYGAEGDITVSEVVDGVITLTVVDNGPSAGQNIYVVSFTVTYSTSGGTTDPDIPAEQKSWTVTCASKKPNVDGEDGLTVAFVDKNGATESGNANDFKFDGSAAKLTLTLDALKAGQTISITVYGYSGSSISGTDPKEYNPVDLTVKTATNAAAAANNAEDNKVTFSGEATLANPESGTFVYTVSADGTVTLELARVSGSTTRLTKVEITVE